MTQTCPVCRRSFRALKAFLRHAARCGKPNRLGSIARKERGPGYLFDSGLERELHQLLCLRELGGEIRELKVKPNVRITDASILVIPDFSAVDMKTGELRFHEAKGFRTEVWKLKMRLWKVYGPAPIDVYVAGSDGPLLSETISVRGNV